MMSYLFNSLPVVGLFLKFIVASTVLLGTVWGLEKLRILRLPDLSELAWKLAIGASFVALLPLGDLLTGPITIHHSQARQLVDRFNEGAPLSEMMRETATPDRTVGAWLPAVQSVPTPNADTDFTHRAEAAFTLSAPDANLAFTPAPEQTGIVQPEADSEETITEVQADTALGQWVSTLSARDLTVAAWAFLTLLATGALCLGYRSAIRDLGSRSRVDAEHPSNQILRALCEQADIRHVPYLSRSADINSPVCLPRREICLPEWAFETLHDAELKSLLAHELGHMVRRDPLMLMVTQLVSRLFFFQPLFGVARRRLSDLAELAADEWAAKRLSDPRAVAAALFTCATKIHDSRNIQWGLAMAGNKSMLKKRVERLVGAKGAHFHNASATAKGVVMVGILGLALGLPSIQFADALSVTAGMDSPLAVGGDDERREAMAAEREARALEREARREAREAEAMARDRGNHDAGHHTHISMDNDSGNVVFTDGDGFLKASWRGKFSLNEDFNGIADIAPGAWLDIAAGSGDSLRRVHAENSDGNVEYSYWVNTRRQELDKEGRQWLAESLDRLTRETGWMASERVAALLKKGGVKTVLAAIEEARTDYTKRLYSQHLLEQAKLKDGEIEKLVDTLAGMESDYELRAALTMLLTQEKLNDRIMPKIMTAAKTIESDYELRQLLTPYIQRFPLDEKAVNILIDMAGEMDSDYELRNLLTVALLDKSLSKDNVERLVKIATDNIDSDYELRQLLGAFASQLKKSPEATKTLIGAVSHLDSDYEKRMTLDILMGEGAMSKENWAAVIEASATIDSDYEKAQALQHVQSLMPNDAGLKKQLDEAIAGIDSDYHRQQVMRGQAVGRDLPAPAPVAEPAAAPGVKISQTGATFSIAMAANLANASAFAEAHAEAAGLAVRYSYDLATYAASINRFEQAFCTKAKCVLAHPAFADLPHYDLQVMMQEMIEAGLAMRGMPPVPYRVTIDTIRVKHGLAVINNNDGRDNRFGQMAVTLELLGEHGAVLATEKINGSLNRDDDYRQFGIAFEGLNASRLTRLAANTANRIAARIAEEAGHDDI